MPCGPKRVSGRKVIPPSKGTLRMAASYRPAGVMNILDIGCFEEGVDPAVMGQFALTKVEMPRSSMLSAPGGPILVAQSRSAFQAVCGSAASRGTARQPCLWLLIASTAIAHRSKAAGRDVGWPRVLRQISLAHHT
jgi:hypothetical protein